MRFWTKGLKLAGWLLAGALLLIVATLLFLWSQDRKRILIMSEWCGAMTLMLGESPETVANYLRDQGLQFTTSHNNYEREGEIVYFENRNTYSWYGYSDYRVFAVFEDDELVSFEVVEYHHGP
jgi:hypothetical protein